MPDDQRGLTPREFGCRYRMGKDRVLSLIRSGALEALNLSPTRCGKPRYLIMPAALEKFERDRKVAPPPRPARRKRRTAPVDYFPEY
jgi:hypothetical protein